MLQVVFECSEFKINIGFIIKPRVEKMGARSPQVKWDHKRIPPRDTVYDLRRLRPPRRRERDVERRRYAIVLRLWGASD